MQQSIFTEAKDKGYSFISNFIQNPLDLKYKCDQLYQEDLFKNRILDTDGSHRVKGLLRLAEIQDILNNNDFIFGIQSMIGSPIIIGGTQLNIVQPNSQGMGFHRDYPYFSIPDHFNDDQMQPLVVQVIVALDDFTELNAPTQFIPGSHKSTTLPNEKPLTALMKQGDAVIMHGGTWHKVLPNLTDKTRTSILFNFHPYWVRPLNNPNAICGANVVPQDLSPQIQSLLGLTFKNNIAQDVQKIGYGIFKK